MKYFVMVSMVLLLATPVQASNFYGNTGYERRIRVACEKATMRGGRLNTPAAKECFYEVIDIHRQQELIDSQIRLNDAKTKWLKDDNRRRYYQRFPE